jgi:hypothetical protein
MIISGDCELMRLRAHRAAFNVYSDPASQHCGIIVCGFEVRKWLLHGAN